MDLLPSLSTVWKNFSNSSREPSSWRIVAGSPNISATPGLCRQAWMSSILLMAPSLFLSMLSNTARSCRSSSAAASVAEGMVDGCLEDEAVA